MPTPAPEKTTSPPVVDVQGLSKSFGNHVVINNLSLTIREGQVYGLVGLNGAGKTTLIRMLLGILKGGSGAISVLNKDPWSHDTALHRRMGVVLEHDGFWGNLTFEQNMHVFAAAKRVPWKEACTYLDTHWSDADIYKSKKPVKFFSRGQRMQCAICRAFLGWPAVFLLDEPVVALDVDAYDHFTRLVRHARAKRAAVLISSHQLDAIDELCDDVGILRDKKITEIAKVRVGSGIAKPWELDADFNEQWGAIIEETCGTGATYDDHCWHFGVVLPKETIPRLVTRLAAAGCAIRRVSPAGESFSVAIKNEYLRKPSTNSPDTKDEPHA
ncbi:MAG: ATP-binding cassette domain-containing protein [Chitinispirillaceae bacterium]|nr:ATP-binding cassette domain-containing protein [Chitinispirillaceae bacterium]